MRTMTLVEPLPASRYGLTARLSTFLARRFTGKPIDMSSIGLAAHVPALVRANGGMERFFMGRRAVDGRLMELVSLRAAMEIGCSFCLDLVSYLLVSKHGLTLDELQDLTDHRNSTRFSAAEQAALDLAVAMTATPPTVDPALDARLREHFSDRELVELMAMIGWENSRARVNLAAGLTAQGYSDPGACALPTAAAERAHAARHGEPALP
jgi:alkylhydroperoxidase family enzyme